MNSVDFSRRTWQFARFMSLWIVATSAVVTVADTTEEPKDKTHQADTEADSDNVVDPRAMEVRFTDDSVLMLVLADEVLEIATRHGKLQIPTADILRIQFARRVPADVQTRIDQALAGLADPDNAVGDAAAKQLLEFGEQAYLAVVQAANGDDKRLAERAKVLRNKIAEMLGARAAALSDHDVLETSDARIVGLLTATQLKVTTRQFGDLSMKLADASSMRSQSQIKREPTSEPIEVLPDPGNLQQYQTLIGKTLHFRVIGAIGSLYGTDVYTTDSSLAAAAVHCGVLKLGETGVVAVKIVPSPNSFTSSVRHGIASSDWGSYPSAYQIVKRDKAKPANAAVHVPIPVAPEPRFERIDRIIEDR